MELIPLEIEGAWLATSSVWPDNRGSFREWFRSSDIKEASGIDFSVSQANFSISHRGVVRGIHYSLAKAGQAKWVTCVSGAIKDIIVDIRPASPTFGQFVALDLEGDSGKVVLIGEGLGHGFISLKDNSSVSYLVSSPFSPMEEFEINPLDPAIGIEWGVNPEEIVLSAKDKAAPSLAERNMQGKLPR